MNKIKKWFGEFINLFFPSISAYKTHDKALIEYIENTTILEINCRRILALSPFLILIPAFGLKGIKSESISCFYIILVLVIILTVNAVFTAFKIKKALLSQNKIQINRHYYEKLHEHFWIVWTIGMIIIGFGRLNTTMNGSYLMLTQLCLAFMPLIPTKKMKRLGIATIVWAVVLCANIIYFGFNDYLLPALFFIVNSMAMVFIISYIIQRLNLSVNVMVAYAKLIGFLDQLTGISNRRGFKFRLNELISEETRAGVLMFDIDFFKQYNDTYGHIKGDEILVTISNTVKEIIDYDNNIFVRYGGEEFAIVSLKSDKEKAKNIAEQIMQAVSELQIPCPDNSISNYLTISIGISETTVNNDSSLEDIISEADKALYDAKKNGRNQIVVA